MPDRIALFYCQHSLGIGHLTRSFALAAALRDRFEVVFLNGGPLPEGIRVPAGVRIIDLPALGMDDGHTVVSRADGVSVETARLHRRAQLLEAVSRHNPAVLIVELFPFGRKKFAGEILPMVRAARAAGARIVCSLRDILVDARPDQQKHDDRARWLAQRYFDAVLVHADPGLARLEDSFRPRRGLTLPVIHTGYVIPEREPGARAMRKGHVLVSAGGGKVGGPLFEAALKAQAALWPEHRLRMRLIAGPFLPETQWLALRQRAEAQPDVELVRHVSDMVAEMRLASVSISQCGYNTALDVLVAQVPAIMVPYAPSGENEQRRRADTLLRLGAIHSAPATSVDLPNALCALLPDALDFRAGAARLDVNGAARSVEAIDALCSETTTPRCAHA